MVPSYRLKLRRAFEHLYALNASIDWWRQGDPCIATSDCEIKTRKHRIWVKVVDEPDDPQWPLLIGDCVHNTRQALDQLAYRLAIRVARKDPPPNAETTAFPIYSSKSKLDGALPQKVGAPKHMPPGLYAALEGLQPYHGADRGWLGVLHRLDNLDKHRFPPVVAAIGSVPDFHIGELTGHVEGPRTGPIDSETPVIEFIPAPDSKVEMNFNFTSAVAFDQASPVATGQLVLDTLGAIVTFALRGVVDPLEEFL